MRPVRSSVRLTNSSRAAWSSFAAPTPAQVADAKYGDVPIRYEETIRQYFQKHLKDPVTVQYQ